MTTPSSLKIRIDTLKSRIQRNEREYCSHKEDSYARLGLSSSILQDKSELSRREYELTIAKRKARND